MQLQALILAGLALATGAAADRILTTRRCRATGGCTTDSGEWYNNNGGRFGVNANEGCRNPGVPGIYNVCMDWGNNRAHFDATGQNKRCLRKQGDFNQRFCGGPIGAENRCSQQWWEE